MSTPATKHPRPLRPGLDAAPAPRIFTAARGPLTRTSILLLGARGSGVAWLSGVLAAHHHRPVVQHRFITATADADDALHSYPHARPLHIIRDGRDVVAESARADHPISPSEVRSLAARWAAAVHAVWTARDTHAASIIEARYERLRSSASAHGERLLDSLTLDPTDDALALLTSNLTLPPPQSASWKSHFTNDAKHAFKATAGSLLIELGYERDTDW